MNRRSVYAKALEDNRYRRRVIENKRKEDFNDWIEDDLNEYYTEKISKTKTTQTNKDTRQHPKNDDS